MQNDVSKMVAQEGTETANYERKIDSTVYRVTLHYSLTSTETVEDKLIRLMESEVKSIA
jgi:hypothetical protein